jgi:hypothetical protein
MRKMWTLLLVAMLVVCGPAGASAAAVPKTFTAGFFTVSLDGGTPELVQAVEGGDLVGVVESTPVVGGVPNKRLAGDPVPELLSFRFPPGSPTLATWIGSAFPPAVETRDGAVTYGNDKAQGVAERTFQDALVTRVVFPKLDAASKDPASILLLVQPAATIYGVGSAGVLPVNVKQKSSTLGNFRLAIDGLDTSQVAIIDALEVEQPLVAAGGGFEPAGFAVSNLVVSLGAASSTSWFEWFEDFVVQGNNGDAFERDGRLEFLSPDLKTVVATLELQNLGIVSIGADRADGWVTKKGAKAATGRVVAELYVENVTLKPGP